MAFDISTEYYTALRKKVVSGLCHVQPSIPISAILDYFKKVFAWCDRFYINLICVTIVIAILGMLASM